MKAGYVEDKYEMSPLIVSQRKPRRNRSTRMAVSRLGFAVLTIVVFAAGIAIGFLSGFFSKDRVIMAPPSGPCLQGVHSAINQEGDPTVAQRLLDILDKENIRENLRKLTLRPHLAGTEADYRQARHLADFWKEVGLDTTRLQPYDVLLSYPDSANPNRIVILDSNQEVVLQTQLFEKILRPEMNQSDVVPPYNAFSATGEPKGDLVYVNYARVEDFQWLKENKSIDVTGKIVISRYGRIARFSKSKIAADFGAIGLILYTDPSDYAPPWVNDAYPDSWWMPKTGVQRGTAWSGGDPLTPGYPSIESAYRIQEKDAGLPTIPVHPISYDDARKLMLNLQGEEVPPSWRGDLPITYRFGPGFRNPRWKVQMKISTHTKNVTIYNAYGFIQGSIEPDRYVIIGNHIDAWVFGAVDPSSGTACLMELARGMADLLKHGWRPRRSIVFVGWGAEEFGLVGSKEWVEHHSSILSDRVVAYLNVDIAVQGNYTFRGRGLPLLFDAMLKVAKRVPNPDPLEVARGRRTVYDTWRLGMPEYDLTGSPTGKPRIPILGSGSDFDPFVTRIGVTSADFRYHFDERLGISSYPLYHSAYELFHLMETHIDPEFRYHLAVSQYVGELARELADSLIVPFDVAEYPKRLKEYADDIEYYYGTLIRNNGLGKNLDYFHQALNDFEASARAFKYRLTKVNTNNPIEVRSVNDQMMLLERVFINPEGLPGRPLDRHVVYAPSAHDSYAGSSFPGIIDSLFDIEKATVVDRAQRWDLVHQQLSIDTYFIKAAANVLKPPNDL